MTQPQPQPSGELRLIDSRHSCSVAKPTPSSFARACGMTSSCVGGARTQPTTARTWNYQLNSFFVDLRSDSSLVNVRPRVARGKATVRRRRRRTTPASERSHRVAKARGRKELCGPRQPDARTPGTRSRRDSPLATGSVPSAKGGYCAGRLGERNGAISGALVLRLCVSWRSGMVAAAIRVSGSGAGRVVSTGEKRGGACSC